MKEKSPRDIDWRTVINELEVEDLPEDGKKAPAMEYLSITKQREYGSLAHIAVHSYLFLSELTGKTYVVKTYEVYHNMGKMSLPDAVKKVRQQT